jgi:O-antigen ligase
MTQFYKREVLVLGAAIASIGYVFSIATGSIGLMLFLLAWVLNYREVNLGVILKRSSLHLLLLFFGLLIIQVFYSLNIKQGQKDIMRFLAFIIFPLIFLTSKPFDQNERIRIVRIFVRALSMFFIICFVNAMIRQIGFWSRGGIFNWYYFYRYDFLEIFRQHPTYISMYSLLSLGFLLHEGRELFKGKAVLYSLIGIQTLAIIFYGSRIGYAIFLMLGLIYMLKNLKKTPRKIRPRAISIYLGIMIVLCGIAWTVPIVKERILYTLGYEYNYKFNDGAFIKESSPVEQGRLLLWEDAIDLIRKRPIFGYGTGSNRQVLLEKFKKVGHTLFLEKRYNVHNTYLELLLQGGIPLLITFLGMLMALFYKSFRQRDYGILSFAIIMTLTSITETIFLAQGIAFFAFFYCFFLTPYDE